MSNRETFVCKCVALALLASAFITARSQAQVTVGLDNYYNHEINAKTGKAFHYLWDDAAFSGFSQWGKIFAASGASLTTLPAEPDADRLKDVDIYIIVDPDTTTENPSPHYISGKDVKTIGKWVKKGGVLVLMANDKGNCEFTHLNRLAAQFGLHFNPVSLNKVTGRQWEMGAITDLPQHPVFKDVRKIYMKEVSSLNVSGAAKPVLVKDGQVLMAESRYGKGFVFAVGDPWIYNEYIGHALLPADFENHRAAQNLTGYLISLCK